MLIDRALVYEHPELIDEIKAEAKATLDLCKRCELLMRLRKFGDWNKFDWALFAGMANPVDEPFCKLMLSLSMKKYRYNCISMHRWWRRLKAVNQHHLISYFTYTGFPEPGYIEWEDVYRKCCRTSEIFKAMGDVYSDDRCVEMNLRAMLGLSQQSDIKQAWLKWAKLNHPDKGGSVERFVLVKSAYEEWYNAHNNT